MKDKIIGAGIGVVLTATTLVAVPKSENPTYTKEGDKIHVERNICEPFEYSATKADMIKTANSIQATIDSGKVLNIPLSQKEIDRFERYKTRFIEDANKADNIGK